MKLFLKFLFAAVLATMLVVTVWATSRIGLFEAWADYARNPWAVATLFDAYSGFLIFFVWVAYEEHGLWRKALWFALIMGLGNIATSLYVLIQLFQLKATEPVTAILGRRER